MDWALSNGGKGYDTAIVGGDFVRVDGDAETAQAIEMALRTFLGESVYDRNAGVPYIEIIFQPGVTLQAVRFILEQQILAVPGVSEVFSLLLSLDHETRVCTGAGKARLTSGTVVDFGVEAQPQ